MPMYYAHSGTPGDYSDWQPLKDHLRGVAERAQLLCREASPGDPLLQRAAYVAGLLHDLGKYRPEFQAMLRGVSVQKEKTYHKQAGAAKASEIKHAPIAFAIAGHHGSMPDKAKLLDLVQGDSGKSVATEVWPHAITDCPALQSLVAPIPRVDDNWHADLFTRVVFSCLVDADWSDTAEHERIVRNLPPESAPPSLEPQRWLERLKVFIRQRAAECKDAKLAGIRDEVLQACLARAVESRGLFAMNVPTGGGKTLSGLAFALAHAAGHGRRRIIYVAPYLSILEQNARVIREALGFDRDAPEVFEHHSLSEPPGDEKENETARNAAARRAENWDAPLVITTSVQFFESLFANKPGRCRKVHNIAGSVILLDECQTLPPDLVAPTCSMLGQLVRYLSCTVVLCTATQPAWHCRPDLPEGLTSVRDIIPPERDLFAELRRVQVTWPQRDEALDWENVARRMREERSALCIVNTRRAARELFQALKDQASGDVLHLSTSMCPAHRLAVLDTVRARLVHKQPCYLVSTQLIEAGVDVDFPFVMRELAPLEAVIQSAGRCNREGLLNAPDGSPGGRVVVFRSLAAQAEPLKYYPTDRWYKAGRSVLQNDFLNNGREPLIDCPADMTDYFVRLYRTGELDKHNLQEHRKAFRFETVAQAYRLIDEDGVPVVVATWEERRDEVENLLRCLRQRPSKSLYRKLAPFQVNLRRYEMAKVGGSVAEEASSVFVWRGIYDCEIGLVCDNEDALLII